MPIEVKSKGVANLISGETNVWDYPFFLNVEPDARWIILFRKHFSLSQNVAPIFSGNVMVLSCIPANLANRYQAVKPLVGWVIRTVPFRKRDHHPHPCLVSSAAVSPVLIADSGSMLIRSCG